MDARALAVIVVIVASAAVAAASGDAYLADERRVAAQDAAAWARLPAEQQGLLKARGEAAGLGSVLTAAGGDLSGTFVAAGFDASNGSLARFTVRDDGDARVFFKSATVDTFTSLGTNWTGAAFYMHGSEGMVRVVDAPSARIAWRSGAEPWTVTFELPPSVEVTSAATASVTLTTGTQHAHVVIAGERGAISSDGPLVRARLSANASLFLITHPTNGTVLTENLHDRVAAFADGRLAAETSLWAARTSRTTVVDSAVAQVALLTYATPRAIFLVTGTEENARAVTFHVDAATAPFLDTNNMSVLVNGRAAERVGDVTAALEAPRGADASFALTVAAGAAQFVLNLPGPGAHQVTFDAIRGLGRPSSGSWFTPQRAAVVAVGAAVLILLVGRDVLRARRKKRR